ncbi:MAG: D-alanyl-D-alanine carboxypeptidase family protein [bacterium]
MPETARRGWLGPLLIFAVVLAVMVSVLAGVARGDTATTLPAASPSGSTEGRPSVPSSSAGGAQTAIFTVRAKDLGDFAVEPPSIASPSAILINMQTGKVLYERKAQAHVRRPMASTTKIMTGILVLENMDLNTAVTVSRKAAQTIEPKTWLKEGDVLTVDQLLYALLLRSANSAAVALAEACSGSVEAFAALMNAKAKELGMTDTKFVNPNGLDQTGHYSTAADMARLGQYAMTNQKFRNYVGTKSYTLSLPGRSEPIVFESTNKLLGRLSWVTGIKTGLTPKAEQCLVGSGTKDGVSVISVVLGQPVPDVCWNESKALMEYGFSQYRHVALLNEGVVVAETTVPYQLDGRVELLTEEAVEMDLYKDEEVITSIALDRPLVLPVKAGESFGRVVLTVDGETVGTVNLVANKSFAATTLGSKLAYYWDRFTRWVGRTT